MDKEAIDMLLSLGLLMISYTRLVVYVYICLLVAHLYPELVYV